MSDRKSKLARRQKRKVKQSTAPVFDGDALEQDLVGIHPDIRDFYRITFISASRLKAKSEDSDQLFTSLAALVDKACNDWSETAKPACVAGCAFCCHQDVTLAPFELEAVVEEMHRLGIEEHVAGRLQQDQGMVQVDSVGHQMPTAPCPFLENNRCMIYEKRPLGCRAELVMDASMCESALESMKQGKSDVAYARGLQPAASGVAARKAIEPKKRVLMRVELAKLLDVKLGGETSAA